MQLMGFPFWEISYLYVDNDAHDKLTKVSQGHVLLKNRTHSPFLHTGNILVHCVPCYWKKSTTFSEHFHIYYQIARSDGLYATTMIQCLVEVTYLHEADINMYIFLTGNWLMPRAECRAWLWHAYLVFFSAYLCSKIYSHLLCPGILS